MRLPRAEPAGLGVVRATGLRSSVAPSPVALACACVLAVLPPAAGAQRAQADGAAAKPPALYFQPYASLAETLTDNVDLAVTGKRADAVTRATVGLGMRSKTGRFQGNLDYSLSGLVYAANGSRNTYQQYLKADMQLEWYERQGFLQASASISQMPRSAFGVQYRVDGLPNANATEVRTASIAPRWQGQLGGLLQVDLGGEASISDSKDSRLADSSATGFGVQVSPFRPGLLSWSLAARQQDTQFDNTRSTYSQWVYGTVLYNWVDMDLRLSVNGGREATNLTSVDRTSRSTWGAAAEWRPSPRTRVLVRGDQRAYGKTHEEAIEYRTPLTVWRFSNSRSINTTGSALIPGPQGRAFDIYYALFESIEPDLVRRADLVLAYLASLNISPTQITTASFLRSAATVDDRLALSAAWRHARSTFTVDLGRVKSRRAQAGLTVLDDLDLTTNVDQRFLSMLFTHRLAPELVGSLSFNTQTSDGLRNDQSSRQQSYGLQLGGSLSAFDTWSLVLRRTLYETNQAPYTEHALVATYGRRF